ncbi:hypothetical protein AVEN_133049-1 [Araneus ventricosus]|uniref:Uncharacterized protein n=1 Tax=Araneus ventricosus TaxID=182803 RepID=A0A4Y2TLY7_ARAVE|nr:hypothetical protein AVEN_133049-1 [Araneus ventricosus]
MPTENHDGVSLAPEFFPETLTRELRYIISSAQREARFWFSVDILSLKENGCDTVKNTTKIAPYVVYDFAKSIEEELINEAPNVNQLSIWKVQIENKSTRLEKRQTEITDLIFKDKDVERAYEEVFLSAEKYRYKFSDLCAQIQRLSRKKTETKVLSEKRKFKLRKIELKKFTGDTKEYLSFWSQFRKIHADTSIPNEDKMQCLLQAVVPKTKATPVVESFPDTDENYPKADAKLRKRFDHDDLLVQAIR